MVASPIVAERLPARLPAMLYWACGAIGMLLLSIINKSTLDYAALVGLFTLLTGVAIQCFGGLKTLFGLCTAMLAVQHVLYSQIVKALLQEAPDARLIVPITTMAVYCVGMVSVAAGAYVSRYLRIAGGRSFFPIITDLRFMKKLAVAATILGFLRSSIVTYFNYDTSVAAGLTTSGFVGPMRQLGFLDALAVVAGTAVIIISSNGRRSLGVYNLIPIAIPIIAGFFGTYRAGTGAAILSYLLACWAYGFKFRLPNYVGLAIFAYVFFFIISPYSIAARTVARTSDFGKNLQRSLFILGDVIANPGKYHEDSDNAEAKVPQEMKQMRYYSFPSLNLERFAMIKNADAIVSATVYRGTMGWRTIIPGIEMLPPSWLYDDKPVLGTANLLAHRWPGIVNRDDTVTQITIGSFADAFNCFGWLGIALIPGLLAICWVVMFSIIAPLTLVRNSLTLSLVPILAVSYSEAPISLQIVAVVQGSLVMLVGLAMPYGAVKLLDATYLRRRRIKLEQQDAATARDLAAV